MFVLFDNHNTYNQVIISCMSLDRDMKLISTKKIHRVQRKFIQQKVFLTILPLKKISTSLEQEATKFVNLPHTS